MADDLKRIGRPDGERLNVARQTQDRRHRSGRLRKLTDELGITSPKTPDYRRSDSTRVKEYGATKGRGV